MSHWREDILTLTSSNKPISFCYWTTLLNFFDKHKDQLDIDDVKIIVDKCEECRIYLNEHSKTHIEQYETNPNIYEYLKQLKKNKTEVTDKSPVRTTLIACHQ